ncbi:MAG TPA: methyltransferase, TIGR04325 family [Lysobacter sp.]
MSATEDTNSLALPVPTAAPRRPLLGQIKQLPFVQRLLEQRRLAFFQSPEGFTSHYGVFESFDAAREFLPPTREYDLEVLGREYVHERMHRVYAYDYPVMLWLQRAFDDGARGVFDIGGSVGVAYFGYAKYLDYPEALDWQVYEVPAICALGRRIAEGEGAHALGFVDRIDPARVDADVWLSAGAIHCIEDAQAHELLGRCRRKPRHIILNKLPLYAGDDFVSTQNIGEGSFSPHYVYNRERYIRNIEAVGYRLVDAWDVPERSFHLPGHPERSFRKYSGLYFRAI